MEDRREAMRVGGFLLSNGMLRERAAPTSDELNRLPGKKGVALVPILTALLLCFFPVQIWAQAGIDMGSITGTVKDPSGALVNGAQCTLTNVATAVSQKTVSTSAGAYTFSLVPVGTYSLKIVASGFKEYLVNGIVIHLGSTDTEDVMLQVGAVTEQVTVNSAPPLLQAQDASLGTTVNDIMANNLPIFAANGGRNFMTLTSTAPGVQFASNANNSNSTIFVNGTNNSQVDVRLNGADDNAEVFGGITIPPIPDAIEEFKLESGNNSADLGHSYGPVVNVVTKTGTNQYKGEVWEYNGNDMFNANDYFNKLHQLVTNNPTTPNRPARYKLNSFGGLFGGPVRLPHYDGRNRTFFFVDFQRTNFTQTSTYTGTVPTATMQTSGFTNLADTLTLNYQTVASSAGKSEKTDGLGRVFQIGTMLDPSTTRAVAPGAFDSITNLQNTGASTVYVRDPYFGSAPAGCPSLVGTKNFNSTINQGSVSPSCLNQLPASRLDPNALALLKLFPAGNQQTGSNLTYSNNYYHTQALAIPTTQFDIRVDHKISDKDSVLVTYSHYNQINPGFAPLPGVLEGGGNVSFATTNPTYMIVATETHQFKPNLINEFRFGVEHNYNTRFDPGSINQTLGTPAQYGIQGIPQTANNGGLPTFNIGIAPGAPISQFGSRTNITVQTVGAWEYSDNLTKVVGKHELKVGGQFDWTYGNIAQLPNSRGNFSYNGMYSNVPFSGDGNTGMADFLLVPITSTIGGSGLSRPGNIIGGASGYAGNNYALSTYHAPYLAFYGIDNWKLTPNFTANLGLRYEYFGPYYSDGGQQGNLWMGADGNSANGAAYYVGHDGCAATMSPSFRALLAYDNIPIICQANNAANKMPLATWAPRVGFAYRIRPNLVARMGGGVAYGAFGSVGYGGTLGTNYPFRFNINSPSGNNAYTPQKLTDNVTTATMESTFGQIDMTNAANATQPLGSVVLTGKQYNYHVPHVTTLNFAVQWQFTQHDSIQATYVGNLGKDLDSAGPYHNAVTQLLTPSTNVVTLSPTASNPYAATGYVPFPNLSPNAGPTDFTNQVSNYQSAQVEYQHQFGAGYSVDANYTFSRCWSDTEAQNNGAPGIRAPFVKGFGGIRNDYTRCSNNAAHLFHFSGALAVPVGKGARYFANANTFADAIIGGWHFSYIWIASSGDYANITCQGTNGYGGNPNFNGPWFASGTALGCYAPTVPGQPLYGPGPRDLPRTRTTGYWNSSAFTAPQNPVLINGQADMSPLGVRGNQLLGPGFYDIDASFYKQWNTGEDTKLTLGVQAINLFNHVQLSLPGTSNYTSPSSESLTGGFGTITSDRNGARQFQLFGKFYF
jgi:Carboxypeptidase regulatory-like domain